MLRDGKLNFYWIQVNNNLRPRRTIPARHPCHWNPDNFIVVSDAYPTVTAMAADLVLPTVMWVEKEGAYGNAERRTHVWRQLVDAPGESRSDLWQMMEFSKRFTTDEVWPEQILAANPNYRGKTLFDVLFRNGNVDKFAATEIPAEYETTGRRSFYAEGAVRGIRPVRGHGHDLAPFDTYHEVRGLRWLSSPGETKRRYREARSLRRRARYRFLRPADGARRLLRCPTSRRQSPDKEYDIWLVTAALSIVLGSMTRCLNLPRHSPAPGCS
jgi:nitrate reductase NapA